MNNCSYYTRENYSGKFVIACKSPNRFIKAKNIKNHNTMNSYEKLYFLLALVDTLEPTKRGISLKEIDIQVDKAPSGIYELHINLSPTNGDQGEYLNGISKLRDWLNFVEVDDGGKTIHIDFQNNKNHLQIAQMNT